MPIGHLLSGESCPLDPAPPPPEQAQAHKLEKIEKLFAKKLISQDERDMLARRVTNGMYL